MKTALGKKSASAIAVAALAIGIGIGVAPAADAATATTKFSRQFIGAYNPSGGPITWSDFIFRPATIGLATATPVVITDTATPGKTRIDFQTTIECYCVVNWKNQSTGGSGTVAGNLASPFDTGSGRVTATVTIDEGITFLAGSGAWTVP